MKKFLISEEEKQRILGMHIDATKRHYLSEQIPKPKPGKVSPSQEKVSVTEISGSADADPIVSPTVLSKYGIPTTQENFNNTFFYTDREGLKTATVTKNLSTFNKTTKRTTKSPDNLYAKYSDGSEVSMEGSGTTVFPTSGLTYIGGAGNGLLALSRAISKGIGRLPSKIKITLSGEREGGSYSYDSQKVNKLDNFFGGLLAYFIAPYSDPTKVNPTYFYKNIINGQPLPTETIDLYLNRFLTTFVPSPFNTNVEKYGLDMGIEEIKNMINTPVERSKLDSRWSEIVKAIVAKYKENLEKFLTAKFPQDKDAFMAKFNPTVSSDTPTEEIKDLSLTRGPGTSTPVKKPTETQKTEKFKSGQ
jgi:hypothetical protein